MEIASLLEEKILTISSMESYCCMDKTAPSQETASLSIGTTGKNNRLADYPVENDFRDIQWDKQAVMEIAQLYGAEYIDLNQRTDYCPTLPLKEESKDVENGDIWNVQETMRHSLLQTLIVEWLRH